MREENISTPLVRIIQLTVAGYLYPDRDRELTEADTLDKLKDAMKGFEYEKMLN